MYIELAKELVDQYGTVFVKVFNESLGVWHQVTSIDGVDHKNRTKSNFIWDTAIHKLRTKLIDDVNFYFPERNGTTFILYKQTFLIRIKKLGKNKRPSFIKTLQAEKFQNQLDLGFGDYVNVYLNYSFDFFGVTVDTIRLQCENGNSKLWSFLLNDHMDIITPDLFSNNQATPNKRIRIKGSESKEKVNGTEV